MISKLKIIVILLIISFTSLALQAHEAADMPSLTKGDYGMSFVTYYGNNSFLIAYGTTIYVDPVNVPDGEPKADAILITHPHPENFSISDINKLLGGYTNIYGPADVIAKVREAGVKVGEGQLHILTPRDEVTTGSYQFRAFPAYNTTKDLHPQANQWLGYIVSVFTPRGESNLYFTGDTNKIPEMEELNGKIDVVFISLDKEHGVDSVSEAVEAATTIDPEMAVPTRYTGEVNTGSDPDQFVGMLSEIEGIDGIIMNQKH